MTAIAYRVTAPIAAFGVGEQGVNLGLQLLLCPARNKVSLLWDMDDEAVRNTERKLKPIDLVPFIADGRLEFIETIEIGGRLVV